MSPIAKPEQDLAEGHTFCTVFEGYFGVKQLLHIAETFRKLPAPREDGDISGDVTPIRMAWQSVYVSHCRSMHGTTLGSLLPFFIEGRR